MDICGSPVFELHNKWLINVIYKASDMKLKSAATYFQIVYTSGSPGVHRPNYIVEFVLLNRVSFGRPSI